MVVDGGQKIGFAADSGCVDVVHRYCWSDCLFVDGFARNREGVQMIGISKEVGPCDLDCCYVESGLGLCAMFRNHCGGEYLE